MKKWIVLMAVILFVQCHKPKPEADKPATIYSLLDKTLPQIENTIVGNWQVRRRQHTVCPILPPCYTIDSFYRNNEGDRFTFFLSNNHIRNTDASGTNVRFDEIPTITRIRYSSTIDSVYVFRIATGNHQYIMQEIRQDTLLMNDSYGVSYYLTPKL